MTGAKSIPSLTSTCAQCWPFIADFRRSPSARFMNKSHDRAASGIGGYIPVFSATSSAFRAHKA